MQLITLTEKQNKTRYNVPRSISFNEKQNFNYVNHNDSFKTRFSHSSDVKKPIRSYIENANFSGLFDALFESTLIKEFGHEYGTQKKLDFAGDNFGPVHPDYRKIILFAGHVIDGTYQQGHIDQHCEKEFENVFGDGSGHSVTMFLTPTGTSANRLSTYMLQPHECMISTDIAHAFTRESGAIAKLNGASIKAVSNKNGKLDYKETKNLIRALQAKDHYAGESWPKIISISQPTEYGTLYSTDEIKALAKLAHDNNMLLQMDGARLFYAAASMNKSLKELTTDCGVDMLFMGGSKNMMSQTEAVVFLPSYFHQLDKNPAFDKIKDFFQVPKRVQEQQVTNLKKQVRKSAKQMGVNVGQSATKAAQWLLALENDFGINLAKTANQKAKKLEEILLKSDSRIQTFLPTTTNVVLISAPKDFLTFFEKHYKVRYFLEKDPKNSNNAVVRLMTNAMTTDYKLERLSETLKEWQKHTKTGG